jgi:putative PIN family toxin of toxin-antitoxin system
MQKIVIDTNVIVSSLIQRSYPYKIIHELFIDDRFLLCVSKELMSEYYEVLSRPKDSRRLPGRAGSGSIPTTGSDILEVKTETQTISAEIGLEW